MMLPPDKFGIVFNYQQFTFENRIHLYSADFQVVVVHMEMEGEDETIFERCIVGFLGENNTLVAHTDVHRYASAIPGVHAWLTTKVVHNLILCQQFVQFLL